MKLLLILGSDKTSDTITAFLKPSGIESIRYRHVQKAMDNIEEIDPDAIIISANDFPRHWKPLVSFVRSERQRSGCSVIVLKGKDFSDTEIKKAAALEVNGLLPESLDTQDELEKLQILLGSCKTSQGAEIDAASPAFVSKEERIGFVFSHPIDEKIITGVVSHLSSSGFFFEPGDPALIHDINPGTELQNCTLRKGDEFLSPVCAIRTTGDVLGIEFVSKAS